MSRTSPPTRNEELLGFGIIIAGLLVIDAAVTTGIIAVIAESDISLIPVFLTACLNILGAPLALIFGFEFPRWVWVFIIVGWVGQPFILLYGLESILDNLISFVVGGGIAFIGFLSGWGTDRVVDTLVAIMMPFSSGISMTGPNPFNFNSTELGVVAFGWILLFVIFMLTTSGE